MKSILHMSGGGNPPPKNPKPPENPDEPLKAPMDDLMDQSGGNPPPK